MADDVALVECKLKQRCPNKSDPDLFHCWNPECSGLVHSKCSALLLNKHDAPIKDRPTADERNSQDEPVVFCLIGCYRKWCSRKKKEARAIAAAEKAAREPQRKKKTPWEQDGSLDVLMEWLTTEGNHADCCGATGNKGKSKTQHHKELAILIKSELPESDRNEKDVENKIVTLERQFRLASDWANNTGQGVANPGDFEDAIKKRCPLYHQLEPIVGDRPNAKPLASSDDIDADITDGEDDASGVADTAALSSMNRQMEEDETPPKSRSGSLSSASAKRRLMTTADKAKKKVKKGNSMEELLAGCLGGGDDDGPDSMKSLRIREVAAKEREAQARMTEAEAIAKKSKTETIAALLRKRKKLLEEGVSKEETDKCLPLE